MTKRQTRLFFIAGTTLFAAIFIAHDDRQPPAVRRADARGRASRRRSIAGKHVWHRKNCINCHTLLGEGAYYAPDLTKITQQRGEAYLRQFLQGPVAASTREEQHGRLMPNPNLSDEEIDDVIAFLDLGLEHRQPGLAAAADPGQRGDCRRTRSRSARRRRPPPRAIRSRSARRSSGGRRRPASAAIRPQPGVQPRRTVAGRHRHARAPRSCPSPTYKGTAHDAAKTTSANRSSIRTPTSCPAPTFSAGGPVDHAADLRRHAEARGDRPPRRLSRDAQVRGASGCATARRPSPIRTSSSRMLLYGLQMAFGLLVGGQVSRARSADQGLAAVRRHQGDPHQPADRLGADRLHGRGLLARAGGIAHRAAQPEARLRGARLCGRSAA